MNTQYVLEYIRDLTDPADLRAIRLAADKKIKSQKTELSTTVKVREIPQEAKEIAQYLYDEVIIRYPFMKDRSIEDWAVEVDKLNRIDGYEYNIIWGVAKWSQDDNFWRQQVRSGANLRKHFEKMLIRIKENETLKARVFSV